MDKLLHAKRIYILGVRSASAISHFLAFHFQLIFDNVHEISSNTISEVFEQVFRIGRDDVLLAVSFPRYSSRTIRAMQYAKDRGATVITITDGTASPAAAVSDIPLFAKSDMVSFVDSLVAPMSLANALIVAVSRVHRQATVDSLTGFGNKRAYQNAVKSLESRIKERKANFAVAVFDLNGLKSINDNYGHEYGDQALIDAAKRLKKVFGSTNLFRFGGDEFIYLEADSTPEALQQRFGLLDAEIEEVNALIEDAEKVTNDLRKDIEQLIQMNGIPAEELRRFLQEEHEKVKRDEEGKAAVEALLRLHSGFF